jgi:hypothetical protein
VVHPPGASRTSSSFGRRFSKRFDGTSDDPSPTTDRQLQPGNKWNCLLLNVLSFKVKCC